MKATLSGMSPGGLLSAGIGACPPAKEAAGADGCPGTVDPDGLRAPLAVPPLALQPTSASSATTSRVSCFMPRDARDGLASAKPTEAKQVFTFAGLQFGS